MKYKSAVGLGALLIVSSLLSMAILPGCTENLSGDPVENQKPVVQFVNIPPEGQNFSVNPVIYWWGTDKDGLIDMFRYHVATEAEVYAYGDPYAYILSVPNNGTVVSCDTSIVQTPFGDSTVIDCTFADDWVEIEVVHTQPDPQSSDIVSMSADLSEGGNPVTNYITQFVFLQAVDDKGAVSEIVFRRFDRNDNPPDTWIDFIPVSRMPFVNGEHAGGINTGIRISWVGTDEIDYPSDPPPFEFEWKLFGPYTDEDTAQIAAQYFSRRFVSIDGRVFAAGDTVLFCETTLVADSMDIDCFSVLADEDPETLPNFRGDFGEWQAYFDILNPTFVSGPFNYIIDSSGPEGEGWVPHDDTAIFNVFRNVESDTTLQMNFVFWVRSRDDAFVPDQIPAFKVVPVINPKFEYPVIVFDYLSGVQHKSNSALKQDTAMAYFRNAIYAWGGQKPGLDTNTTLDPLSNEEVFFFDTVKGRTPLSNSSRDYIRFSAYLGGPIPLKDAMRHRIIIMYADAVTNSSMQTDNSASIYKAVDAGVNVWLTARSMLGGGRGWLSYPVPLRADPATYGRYFGVERMVHSSTLGWQNQQGLRIEDFIGTISMREDEGWPNLMIDPELLHTRLKWPTVGFHKLPWIDSIAALPEVNWTVRYPQTQILFLYKSKYEASHFLGNEWSFHAAPVGHRYETSQFRTVHFNFTPLVMQPDTMQIVVDSVLNWLWPDDLGAAVSGVRYPDAQVIIDIDEATQLSRQREEAMGVNIDY